MALFHLESKIHSKKLKNSNETKSISSIVAYRHCFQMGEFDYSKKSGLVTSFMMFPDEIIEKTLNNENFKRFFNHQEIIDSVKSGDCVNLWKSIEEKEKRKDAQLCQELIISLQKELSLEENIKNLKTLVQEHFISKGKVADICIHNTKGGDNPHAHILLTQRPLEQINVDLKTGSPLYEFGKKIREEGQFYSNGNKIDTITPVREMWANLCNVSFANAGLDISISHKTLEAQRAEALEKGDFVKAAELDREPVKHIYRNENVVKRAEIEANAEKAAIYNEKEKERYKLELEMVELGMVTPDFVVKPVTKPVLKTFKDFLKFRTEKKERIIQENVTRYFKNRTEQLIRHTRKVRTRTNEFIHTVRTIVRKSRNEILERTITRDSSPTGNVYSEINQVRGIEQGITTNFEISEKRLAYKQTQQVQDGRTEIMNKKINERLKKHPFYIQTPKYTPF